MSLFSSRPKNRRRRVSRKKTTTGWIDESSAAAAPSRRTKAKAAPADQAHKLNAQIGAIESFLAKHHHAEVQRLAMKKANILPPPDRSAHARARRTLTMAEQRRYHAERNLTSFRFLVLFCLACAIGWWILFAGA